MNWCLHSRNNPSTMWNHSILIRRVNQLHDNENRPTVPKNPGGSVFKCIRWIHGADGYNKTADPSISVPSECVFNALFNAFLVHFYTTEWIASKCSSSKQRKPNVSTIYATLSSRESQIYGAEISRSLPSLIKINSVYCLLKIGLKWDSTLLKES